MKKNQHPSNEFQSVLSQNGEAMNFYENCTQEQKSAIMNQVKSIQSGEQMQSFVDHLPSSTL